MTDTLRIISFPKSGRTWLRVMLDDVGAKSWFTHDGSSHEQGLRLADLKADKTEHLTASVLLLVRDPRDTAVSGFFQVTRRLKRAVAPLPDLLRDERHGIKKVCHFNLQWFAAAPQFRRFAILSYEQMQQASAEALAAAAALAGVALDRKTAERVAANREFARLQAAEASGELAYRYGNMMLPGNRKDRESFKVRRGVVGGYADYMSEADVSYCNAILAETSYWARCNQALSQWGLLQSPAIQMPPR